MLEHLKNLCELDGPSGNEQPVRDYIMRAIAPHCTAEIDKNGNILAFKKGRQAAKAKVLLDAHMDEVGFIITDITEAGLLRFETVGGIETESLLCKRVRIGQHNGVIGMKPIHQTPAEERKSIPDRDSLFIDIGAADRTEATQWVSRGDIGTFASPFIPLCDDCVRAKALDDRVGCAILIDLLINDSDYDFYATFTVGEELGCRGAKTAAFAVQPDYALVLEATTAGDLHGVAPGQQVCRVGNGAVLSFMDRATQYHRGLFALGLHLAKAQSIQVQTKNAVAGGNNAGAISLSREGVKTIAISLPCRYIHSPNGVGSLRDAEQMERLAAALCATVAAGNATV